MEARVERKARRSIGLGGAQRVRDDREGGGGERCGERPVWNDVYISGAGRWAYLCRIQKRVGEMLRYGGGAGAFDYGVSGAGLV